MVIIADTTALIALENAGHFHLLRLVFGELLITSVVASEWGTEVPPWIRVVDHKDTALFQEFTKHVDPGEASSLVLALETAGSKLLTDDRKARLLADRVEVPTTGTMAVLLLAKEQGHIPAVRPLINALQQSGFRVSSDLVDHVLRLAGERTN